MQNATNTTSVQAKAWETKPATSQQRYALFKLTGDSSYKTKKKLTGRMASDLIHDLSAKAVAKKKAKALPKAKAVAPKKTTVPKKETRKPKASGHYVLQGDGATELKGDIKAIALDVKSASAHLRKSADALSSALDRLSSLL